MRVVSTALAGDLEALKAAAQRYVAAMKGWNGRA
jgi:hypothetical protein